MKYNVRSPSMILSSKLKPSIPGQHLVQDSRPIDRPFVKSLFDLASSAFYTRETRTHEEAFLTASLARSSRIERTRECRNASDVTSRRAPSGARAAMQYRRNLVTYVKHKFCFAVSTKCNGPADRPSAKSR